MTYGSIPNNVAVSLNSEWFEIHNDTQKRWPEVSLSRRARSVSSWCVSMKCETAATTGSWASRTCLSVSQIRGSHKRIVSYISSQICEGIPGSLRHHSFAPLNATLTNMDTNRATDCDTCEIWRCSQGKGWQIHLFHVRIHEASLQAISLVTWPRGILVEPCWLQARGFECFRQLEQIRPPFLLERCGSACFSDFSTFHFWKMQIPFTTQPGGWKTTFHIQMVSPC